MSMAAVKTRARVVVGLRRVGFEFEERAKHFPRDGLALSGQWLLLSLLYKEALSSLQGGSVKHSPDQLKSSQGQINHL